MNIFRIDYKKLVRILVPVILRKPAHIAWIQALCHPVNYIYQDFLRSREANLYRLKITPQVVYLQKLLNDRYDIDERRIRIRNAKRFNSFFLYLEEESKPAYVFLETENEPFYLFTEEEVGMRTADFYVIVPTSIIFDENEMRALLDMYKLAGKTYKIQTV